MGAKTKTVGGGAATGVANDWNAFLKQQLAGNPMGGSMTQQMSNQQQPMQQTGGFQQAFGNMMNGNINDISGANAALQNYFQNPNGMNIPTNFGNQYTAPQFSGVDLSQLPTNFGVGQTGMANLSQFGPNAAQSNFNVMGPVNSGFTNQLNSLMQQGGMAMGGNGGFSAAANGPHVNMTPQMDYATAYNTLGQDPLMERNRQKAVADMRARFGAEGAGSMGTGAQFAESNLNAELAAQDASQRRAQAMQLMGQDLAGNSALANVGLQNRGQDAQTAIANMQGGLQGTQNNTALMNQLLGAAGQARGQDINAQLQQLGLGAQQSQFNAGQQNDWQSNLMNSILQNQQMGNQFGVNAAQLNNQAMQNNNLNALNQNQFMNQFNQNNAQNTAQFGQAANALNSQNQQANNALFQAMMNSGLNLNQMGNQNIQQMLAQMFGAYGQSNGLGTPQAQTIQQPSGWGQLGQAALGIGGTLLGGPLGGMIGSSLGGMFGGGGGQTGGMLRPQIFATPNTPVANPIGSYMPTLNLG